ncbi:hypothetical protein Tco_0319998 [Tanacetum coccineum]
MDWGEVNPVHAYYNGSCTSKDNEDPSWSTSFKTRRTQKTSSALEVLWKTLFLLYLYMIGTLSKLEYKFQDKENSEDIFSFGSALEDFISVVFVPDRNIVKRIENEAKTMLCSSPEVQVVVRDKRTIMVATWTNRGDTLHWRVSVRGVHVSVRGQACMDPCQSLAIMRRLVPSCFVIFDLKPLSLSLDFVFNAHVNDWFIDVFLHLQYLASGLYLKGQPKLGLWYPKDSPFDLVAYTDSDYAGASLDRKSTTRGCQFLGCRLISWQCKKQIVVANSITEVEYVATSSCCGQFWSTVIVKTINGEVQLDALVDGKKIIITESSVRRDIQLADEEGVDCLPNSTIFEQLTLIGPKTTAWNEFSSTMASAIICLATNQKFKFSKFIFDSMIRNLDNLSGKFLMYPRKPKRKDTQVPQPSDPIKNVADKAIHKELGDSLMRAATTASSIEVEQDSGARNIEGLLLLKLGLRTVLDLEKTKTTQHNEIASLKRRAKKLKKKDRSRTHRLKRLYKVGLTTRVESSYNKESLGEDASKQGSIDAIDADEEITLIVEEVFVADTRSSAVLNRENKEVNVIEDWHGYAISSLMDTAYWPSE